MNINETAVGLEGMTLAASALIVIGAYGMPRQNPSEKGRHSLTTKEANAHKRQVMEYKFSFPQSRTKDRRVCVWCVCVLNF